MASYSYARILILLWLVNLTKAGCYTRGNSMHCYPVSRPHRAVRLPSRVAANVRSVSVRGYNLPHLTNLHMTGFSLVRKLHLEHDRIETVENGTFSNMSRLQELDLSSNKLTHLTEQSFEGLVNLEKLELSGNSDLELATGGLSGIPRLASLSLYDTNTRLRVEHFTNEAGEGIAISELSEIHTGSSGGNRCDYSSERGMTCFGDLENIPCIPNVRSLRLRGSHDDLLIPRSVASCLPGLENVDMHGCNITRIEGGVLSNLGRVRALDLSENNLSLVSNTTFEGLTELRILNLSQNLQISLPDCALTDLSQLGYLDLRDTVTALHEGLFVGRGCAAGSYPSHLRCKFTQIPSFVAGEMRCGVDSGNSRIDCKAQQWTTTAGLKSLNCISFARLIRELNIRPHSWKRPGETGIGRADLSCFNNLDSINLRRIGLIHIEEGAFSSLSKLGSLTLRNNWLRNLSMHTFEGLQELTHLDLSFNRLLELAPCTLSQFRYLSSLLLCGTRTYFNISLFEGDSCGDGARAILKRVGRTCWQMSNGCKLGWDSALFSEYYVYGADRVLMCRPNSVNKHRRITIFPRNELFSTDLIVTVNLAHNLLTNITGGDMQDLLSVSDLRSLNLMGNRIKFIEDMSFAGLGQLSELDLTGNDLILLTRYTFQGLDNLKVLRLSENRRLTAGRCSMGFLPSLTDAYLNHTNISLTLASLQGEGCMNGTIPSLHVLDISYSATSILHDPLWPRPELGTLTSMIAGGTSRFDNFSNLPSSLVSLTMYSITEASLGATDPSAVHNLTRLHLRRFEYFPIVRHPALTHLLITECGFLSIPNHAFNSVTALVRLELREIRGLLTIESNALSPLRLLQYLAVTDSPLSTMSNGIWGLALPLPSSFVFHANGNPWLCDCAFAQNAGKVDVRRRVQTSRELSGLCRSPAHLRGMKIWRVAQFDICQSDYPDPDPSSSSEGSWDSYDWWRDLYYSGGS